jgi:hypothetical protein
LLNFAGDVRGALMLRIVGNEILCQTDQHYKEVMARRSSFDRVGSGLASPSSSFRSSMR